VAVGRAVVSGIDVSWLSAGWGDVEQFGDLGDGGRWA